ncbi:MAG: hypothetical protein B7Z51_10995 [Methyloversatilis sp. 12-65-5]|nr:MAG: hypothetical protein B7Z51_10995 [Methyloversatilis sp. 12-65-5]
MDNNSDTGDIKTADAPRKSGRRLAREFAVQGIYQWLLSGNDLPAIDAHLSEDDGFTKVDELAHQIETPYRVVINEAIELAKDFGGSDGHKFINGVLDKLAPQLRAVEVEAARNRPRR